MGTLCKHGDYGIDLEEVDISIVDALISPESCYIEILVRIDMSSIEYDLTHCEYLGEKRIMSGRVKSEPLAINFSNIISSMPPTIINPEKETAYEIFQFLDRDVKLINQYVSNLERFRDTIKPSDQNHYIWDGTVEEIIKEFEDAGFVLKENIPRDERQDLVDKYENSMGPTEFN